ncbi:DUF6861 domain-containing protein [Pseudomonas sp. CC120222-01a]|uniref:DUF6861 domain-containing protein n=1 Tax=Pseudomonas sp. CC120222-01a TaxID=1378075 RepID=UPI000D902611|nr:hypothetical protein [Pseudomonas sp. CC120222-01a]PVZ40277.1 hypothetical protein N430_03064 [Pseudomonas sp. CC120222-01a]
MDILANVPTWGEVERNLEQKFSHLNQSVGASWDQFSHHWNGFSRRIGDVASHAYGQVGGSRIESVRLAMTLSYPIVQSDLMQKWASINISEILPILLQLVKEVAMVVGGSVAVGTIAGGIGGSFVLGAGAVPGAVAGAGIGLQVGNLILLGIGLSAIADYFYQGLPACLSLLHEGLATAWSAEDGSRPAGLDPTGAASAEYQENIERAARQLARGQEQLVLLLLMAIVAYLMRGQVKSGVLGGLDSIAARSAKLQAGMSNRQIAGWLARNEEALLARPDLRMNDTAPVVSAKVEPPIAREVKQQKLPEQKSERHPPRGGERGVLEDSVFAQVIAKPTKAFSREGREIYTAAAGRPIKTVDDLTKALQQGVVKPSQVPLDYVMVDGRKVIANTRSSTALINAGIPKAEWYGVNKTGVIAYDNITFDMLVRDQLEKNYGGSIEKARR